MRSRAVPGDPGQRRIGETHLAALRATREAPFLGDRRGQSRWADAQHAAVGQMDRLAVQQDAMLRVAVHRQGHRVPEPLHFGAPCPGSGPPAWRTAASGEPLARAGQGGGHGSPPPAAPMTSLPPSNRPPTRRRRTLSQKYRSWPMARASDRSPAPAPRSPCRRSSPWAATATTKSRAADRHRRCHRRSAPGCPTPSAASPRCRPSRRRAARNTAVRSPRGRQCAAAAACPATHSPSWRRAARPRPPPRPTR